MPSALEMASRPPQNFHLPLPESICPSPTYIHISASASHSRLEANVNAVTGLNPDQIKETHPRELRCVE